MGTHTYRGKSRERSKALWVKDIQHYRERIDGRGGGVAGWRGPTMQHWVNDLLYEILRNKWERGEK